MVIKAAHGESDTAGTQHNAFKPRLLLLLPKLAMAILQLPRGRYLDLPKKPSWKSRFAGEANPRPFLKHTGSDDTARQLSRLIRGLRSDRAVVGSAYALGGGKKSPTKTGCSQSEED